MSPECANIGEPVSTQYTQNNYMKLNTSLVVSTLTLIIGIFLNVSLWVPISVIVASIISLKVSNWVNSERLGSSAVLSSFLKLVGLSKISCWYFRVFRASY